ncbi:unnamed protein product, partial [Mesorhabditis spiculigera]
MRHLLLDILLTALIAAGSDERASVREQRLPAHLLAMEGPDTTVLATVLVVAVLNSPAVLPNPPSIPMVMSHRSR